MRTTNPAVEGTGGRPSQNRRLRPRDMEALRRMQDQGSLTIPQAYDCGHADGETSGHGMNRLVAASLVVFQGWDASEEDCLWGITPRGVRALLESSARAVRTESAPTDV